MSNRTMSATFLVNKAESFQPCMRMSVCELDDKLVPELPRLPEKFRDALEIKAANTKASDE